jgi:acetoin utilization deacetylase AcuC-like enzyme
VGAPLAVRDSVRIVYSPRYHIDIGTHVFPTKKYQLVSERVRASHPGVEFAEPEPASWEALGLVHTADYLRKVRSGDFEVEELAQLEVPWSPEVVEGFRLMTGGTILAAHLAAAPGAPVICHIGGGFHHAFANHGEGFCLFNDVAVAIRVLAAGRSLTRIAVIDLDVHHGNGTALIFANDPSVFTFSMHQQHNYPAFKPRGSLDVGLPDGTGDGMYLDRLRPALDAVFAHAPQMVFYLAGADPFRDDQLGGLSLSKAGLRERDRSVFRACAIRKIPVVVVLAGGYARSIEDTIDIHAATIQEAIK